MSARPAVLHVVWNLIRGGTEGQCARMAMHFAQAGTRHRVAVFRREGYFLEAVEALCGKVYEVEIRHLARLSTLRSIYRLSRFIRAERFDVVHCWDAESVLFGSVAARWAGVPFITSRRDMSEIYPAWKLRWMDWADRRAVAIVVNAEAIRRQRIAAGCREDKLHLVPNILDIDEFDRQAQAAPPLPETMGPRDVEEPWIVSVTRLDPEKDVHTLLHAFQRVVQDQPAARLVIAGDGVERQALAERARALGIQHRVSFLGDVPGVPALLRQCALGVLTPKANEGLANTLLEYMAAGLPIVATDCGGNREILARSGAGPWVGPGEVAELADAICHLLKNPVEMEARGRKGRTYVQNHRPEAAGQIMEGVYRQALDLDIAPAAAMSIDPRVGGGAPDA